MSNTLETQQFISGKTLNKLNKTQIQDSVESILIIKTKVNFQTKNERLSCNFKIKVSALVNFKFNIYSNGSNNSIAQKVLFFKIPHRGQHLLHNNLFPGISSSLLPIVLD